jgi:uncharacterized protein
MRYFKFMRYLTEHILKDLSQKMVFLSGPRQSGKSYLSKHLIAGNFEYLNWDIRKHKKIITNCEWDKDKKLIILDELHKYKSWKNFLKGVFDEYQNKPPILVTGSAKLDTFRKSGDALTGRFFHYRLHPIDIAEAHQFFNHKDPLKTAKLLLNSGGFPEAFLNPKNAERVRQDRFDLVLQEDLRDLSKTNSIQGIGHLIELLRDRVESTINFESLSSELGVSAPTVKKWIEILERLYVIFRVPPYSYRLSNSLKKESKYYFYDCAAATNGDGARLENLVACALLKYCHYKRDTEGKDYQLFYYRDKQKREVDFLVAERTKPKLSIEVKTSDATISPSLNYLKEKINPEKSLQLVLNLDRSSEKNGVKVTSLADWLLKIYEL